MQPELSGTDRSFQPVIDFSRLRSSRNDVREIKKVLLILLATGAFITSAFIAPHATGEVAKLLMRWREEKWRRYRVIRRLRDQQFIQVKMKNGQRWLQLTNKGRTFTNKLTAQLLTLHRPQTWDKVWRVVIFDIPNQKTVERNIFRAKLKELGFRAIQRSVWALPWPCRAEILFLRDQFMISNCVSFFEVQDNPDFTDLKSAFEL